MNKKINLLIFGATGSIGNSVFSIIRKNRQKFNVQGVTCNKNVNKLNKLVEEFKVKKIGINLKKEQLKKFNNFNKKNLFLELKNFHKMIDVKTDIIIFAVTGLECLNLALKIAKSGKKVGLANKECIISLGEHFISLSKKHKTKITPLDSEHNAVFHLLKGYPAKFKNITITATGGPFLNYSIKKLKNISPKKAANHPIWKMGKKISIDSATMMNKALEIIEAKYLFDLSSSQINAVIHPEAIMHASINYHNGTSIALLSQPDMKIPISSLFFDNFSVNVSNQKRFKLNSKMSFIKIDKKKFRAISLCYKVLKMSGIAPHIFNYCNELLVNHFINGRIKFTDIVSYNEITLKKYFKIHKNIIKPKLNDFIHANKWLNKNIYLGKNSSD